MYSAKQVAVVDAAVMRAHSPTDGGVLLLFAALPELQFLVRFVAAWTELFLPSPFFWPAIPASVVSTHSLDGGMPARLQ
jgi:hypothetical protein